MALRTDGTVRAWGRNVEGQCNVPTELSNVVAVAAGFVHSLPLRADGTVRAWGGGPGGYDRGQCNVPVDLTNVLALAGGGYHSLALLADGSVRAWGESMVLSNLPPAAAVSAGFQHSLALVNSGGPPPTVFKHPHSQTAAIGSSARFYICARVP